MIRALVASLLVCVACKGSSEHRDEPPAPLAVAPPLAPTVPGLDLAEPPWIPPEPDNEFWSRGDDACSDGAALRGAAPPRGTAIWCELPDGTRDGGYAEWHPGAAAPLAALGLYARGEKHGLWLLRHSSGKKKAEQTYKDGKLHGMQRTYWPNGNRESDGWYRHGVPNGMFSAYDGGGGISGSTRVTDGTGTIALVHENGTKRIEYRLADGKRDGLEVTYDQGGRALTETTYRAGARQGVAIRRDEAGREREKGSYVDDMKDGVWIEYAADGTETRRVVYRRGEVVP